MYPASAVDSATHSCLLQFQLTAPPHSFLLEGVHHVPPAPGDDQIVNQDQHDQAPLMVVDAAQHVLARVRR